LQKQDLARSNTGHKSLCVFSSQVTPACGPASHSVLQRGGHDFIHVLGQPLRRQDALQLRAHQPLAARVKLPEGGERARAGHARGHLPVDLVHLRARRQGAGARSPASALAGRMTAARQVAACAFCCHGCPAAVAGDSLHVAHAVERPTSKRLFHDMLPSVCSLTCRKWPNQRACHVLAVGRDGERGRA